MVSLASSRVVGKMLTWGSGSTIGPPLTATSRSTRSGIVAGVEKAEPGAHGVADDDHRFVRAIGIHHPIETIEQLRHVDRSRARIARRRGPEDRGSPPGSR